MKAKLQAFLCIVTSLALCGPMTVGALAAETTVSGGGTSKEDPKITVTTDEATDGSGSVTIETRTTEWSDVGADGLGTTYLETDFTTSVTDSAGNVVRQSGVNEGSETTTREKTENVPAVTVTLTPGSTASGTSEPVPEKVTGDRKSGENDPEYDQTVATETQRVVTGTAGEASVSTGGTSEEDTEASLTPIQPVWEGDEQDITQPRPDRFGQDDTQGPEGYDFRYTGWGQDSCYGAYHTAAKTDENGAATTVTEEADIIQFLLADTANPDGPDHTAYCVDLNSGTREGWWYKIDNLETAGYYQTEDAENHIRAIVNHGYWGTADGETGSLTKLRQELADAQQNGDDTVKALLAGYDFTQLTEGEAQAATQMAIWQYGNRLDEHTDLTLTASNYNGDSGWTEEEGDAAAWARINAAAFYLAGLSEAPGNTTEVITENKFIEDISLTVGERVSSSETNDTYSVDLSFALVVTPGENDSLVVQVLQNGSVVATENILPGQKEYTIKGLTLTESEDVNFDLNMTGTQYLEQGVYIYTSEVKENNFSQTMVGIAEGRRTVDVGMSMTLSFEVTEAVATTEHSWRSVWGQNDDPSPTPGPGPDPDPEPTPDPEPAPEPNPQPEQECTPEPIPVPDTPLQTPPEGDIPLATVPKTGDLSALWLALTVLSGGGLAVLLAVPGRKRGL